MNAENQFYPSFAMTQIKAESPVDVPEISADLKLMDEGMFREHWDGWKMKR